MNLTELIRAIIDRNICTRQSSDQNKRFLTEAIVKAIPKREHGEWLNVENGINYDWATCSVCDGRTMMARRYYPFCPNCGADMRGKKNE